VLAFAVASVLMKCCEHIAKSQIMNGGNLRNNEMLRNLYNNNNRRGNDIVANIISTVVITMVVAPFVVLFSVLAELFKSFLLVFMLGSVCVLILACFSFGRCVLFYWAVLGICRVIIKD